MLHYKLVTYQGAQGPRAGLVIEETVHDVAAVTGRASYATVLDVLRDWDAAQPLLQDAARPAGRTATQGLALRDAKLLPPVPAPAGIFCAGANFTDHMLEMARVQNLAPEPDPHSVGLIPTPYQNDLAM